MRFVFAPDGGPAIDYLEGSYRFEGGVFFRLGAPDALTLLCIGTSDKRLEEELKARYDAMIEASAHLASVYRAAPWQHVAQTNHAEVVES